MSRNRSLIIVLGIILIIVIVILVMRSRISRDDPKSVEESNPSELVRIRDSIPSESPTYQQKIPFIIVQTNERRNVPSGMFDAIQSIRDMNPEYEYRYFDDNQAREYLQNNYGERYVNAYDDLIPGAYKADFFRYAFLYRTGGVYIDTGMVAMCPLRKLIHCEDEFIAPEDDDQNGIYNAFICCVPNHPIIIKTLEQCLKNIENRFFGTDTLQITGPDLMASAFETIMQQPVKSNCDYGSGIRLIYHKGPGYRRYLPNNNTGMIYAKNRLIMHTKYSGYYIDMGWYHTNKHYSILWLQRRVYRSLLKDRSSRSDSSSSSN